MKILSKNFINRIIVNEQKRKTAQWLELNGCPRVLNAAYDGYTGIKYKRFPIYNGLSSAAYPDITSDYEFLKREMYIEVKTKMKEPFGKLKTLKMFLENFATGAKWDTKFMMNFPGRDKQGRVQFARYDNQVVTGNYISNNIYGFLCAVIGIPERLSKYIARVYSKGFLEPLISGKFPDKKLLKFSDPISDQDAISSGYKDFRKWQQSPIGKSIASRLDI